MGPEQHRTYTWVVWKTNLFTVHSGIIVWIRFIDDTFLIWNGDSDSLSAFIEYINSVIPTIKFTHEISSTSVNFLDTKVMKDSKGNISTDVYQKPTAWRPRISIGRQHITHTFSIPFSQALRLRKDLYFNERIRTKDKEIFGVFRCLWLQKKQSVTRDEQSSQTNTEREFATNGEGNKQVDSPSNYIQPTHFVHFWNS